MKVVQKATTMCVAIPLEERRWVAIAPRLNRDLLVGRAHPGLRAFLVTCLLLALGSLSAQSPNNGGCTPDPQVGYTAGSDNSSRWEDYSGTTVTGGPIDTYVPQRNNYNRGFYAFRDAAPHAGFLKSAEASLSGQIYAALEWFMWVESGEQYDITGLESKASVTYSFSTTCQKLPSHKNPPNGATRHTAVTKVKIHHDCTTTGDDCRRALDLQMIARMMSGRKVDTVYRVADGTNISLVSTLGGSIGLNVLSTTSLDAGVAGQEINAKIAESRQLGATASLNWTTTQATTTSQATARDQTTEFEDVCTFDPMCHGLALKATPSNEVHFTGYLKDVSSPISGKVYYVKGHATVVQEITVSGVSMVTCSTSSGTTYNFPNVTPAIPPGGGTTRPSGGEPGETPRGKSSAGATLRRTHASQPDTNGLAKQNSRHASFGVTVGSNGPGTKSWPLHFRIASDSTALLQFGAIGRASPSDSASILPPVNFDPNEPIELDPGSWMIEIPLAVQGTGLGHVEASFYESFPVDDTASSTVEVIGDKFTLQDWCVGDHTSSDATTRHITLPRKASGQKLALEMLEPNGNLDQAIVTYELTEGPLSSVVFAPSLIFDPLYAKYHLSMQIVPGEAPVRLTITITSGTRCVVIPATVEP